MNIPTEPITVFLVPLKIIREYLKPGRRIFIESFLQSIRERKIPKKYGTASWRRPDTFQKNNWARRTTRFLTFCEDTRKVVCENPLARRERNKK
jgi:hypothetical protein